MGARCKQDSLCVRLCTSSGTPCCAMSCVVQGKLPPQATKPPPQLLPHPLHQPSQQLSSLAALVSNQQAAAAGMCRRT